MKNLNLRTGLLLGGLLTAPLIGLMYLADQLAGLPFVPFDLFDWLTRVLPGPLITFGIDLMIDTMLFLGVSVVDTAKTAEQAMAVLQFFLIGVVIGALFFASMKVQNTRPDLVSGLVLGALFGLPLVAISTAIGQSPRNPALSILWLGLLFLGWGVAFSWTSGRLLPGGAGSEEGVRSVEKINRRQFLIRLGAATATITVVSAGLGDVLARSQRRRLEATLDASMAHQVDEKGRSPFPNANDPLLPVPGTRPEYTPLKDHYSVFVRAEPTVIDGATWVLPITGLVDNPLMLTLDDIRQNYEPREQYVTLSCISGRIGTSLIGTTLWTGASLQTILAEVQVRSEARYLNITAGDGFHESVELDLIASDERIMLCYAWDGQPLSVEHGFPLRIWLPDRFGMKQPRWITGLEVSDEYKEGYWVRRNWDEVAQVKSTSVIDTVAVDALLENGIQKLVPLGGIAFAGDRGISKVEVRIDGGPWQAAQLRSPLSETTWVIWRYEWPFTAGEHTFEVRCAEGGGRLQIEETRPNRPSGATGLHSRKATLPPLAWRSPTKNRWPHLSPSENYRG